MAEKGNVIIEEQRVYYKIRAQLGSSPKDVKADLDTVYGDKALAYQTITRWIRLFKDRRTEAKDAPRAGRPL